MCLIDFGNLQYTRERKNIVVGCKNGIIMSAMRERREKSCKICKFNGVLSDFCGHSMNSLKVSNYLMKRWIFFEMKIEMFLKVEECHNLGMGI